MADESQTVMMTTLNKPGDGRRTDSDDWVGTDQSDTPPPTSVINVRLLHICDPESKNHAKVSESKS